MPDHVVEHLRADVHRLEETVRSQADMITQLNLTIVRMAEQIRDKDNRLTRHRNGGRA